MEEVNFLSKPKEKTNILGLGVFDGFHLGHQELANKCDALMTFYPHPEFVLHDKTTLKLLTTLDERKDIFSKIFIIEFTKEFSRLSASDFLNQVIKKQIGPKKIVVGYDFSFGHNREGNIPFLKEWGKKNNIEIECVEPHTYNGKIVKSSYIRDCLKEGAFKEAISYLGHPYLIKGAVVKGENRGHKMGFPTANISVSYKKLVPACGVYKGHVLYKNKQLPAAIYIGNKPTFGNYDRQIEVYILDFNDSIYGEIISIELTEKIRSEKQFKTEEDLITQIKKDIKNVG